VKRSIWLATMLTVAGAVAMAPAQADTKIGVVNIDRLIKDSPQGKAVEDALRNDASAKQRELVALQASLKAKQDKLEKDGSTMTADQRSKAEKDLRDGNRDLSQKATAELPRGRGAELRPLAEVRPGDRQRRRLRGHHARPDRRRARLAQGAGHDRPGPGSSPGGPGTEAGHGRQVSATAHAAGRPL